ncbi:unnamed protein product [Malus baccata var. baccata]
MFRAREILVRLPKRLKPTTILQPRRTFCSKSAKNANNTNAEETSVSSYQEQYKQLEKLDFMTATKMLFTAPPSKKKFGLDFHLVQLFFCCMPSLAVYLVAQYARYEIRRMEAEQEMKKKKEEETKAKEIEVNATEEKEARSVPELLEVKVRLDKLEEALKEIVVESKKQTASGLTKDQEVGSEKKDGVKEATDTSSSDSSKPSEKDHLSKQDSGESRPALGKERVNGQHPVRNASLKDQLDKTEDGGASQDARR